MLGRSRAFGVLFLCAALSAAPMPAAAATGPTSLDVRVILNVGSSDLDMGDAVQFAFSEPMDATTAAAIVVVADADGSQAAVTCGRDGTSCTWNVSTITLGGVAYAPGRVLSMTIGAIAGPPGTTPGLQLPAEIIGAGGITAAGVRWDLASSPDFTVDVEVDATTYTWTALQRRAHFFFADESTDSIADIPRGFTRTWSAAIFKEPRGDPEWPARVQVTTGFDPTTLTTYPEAVPTITPPNAVYQWASTTNTGPQPALTSRVAEVQATGLSLERNVYGGRDIGAGMTVRRTFTVVGRASQSLGNVQLSITLGPQPGQAVTPSAVACAQPPTIYGSQYDWAYYGVVAGTELLVQCDVTLTNTSTSAARWAPHIVVNAMLSFDEAAAPSGATTIVGTSDIGETRFTIEPPLGSNVQGTLRSIVQRMVSLRGENRTTAPPASPAVQWNAQSSYMEYISLPDDVALDAIRPMQRSWNRAVYKFDSSPAWPVGITLDTALRDINVFPTTSAVPTAGGFRYNWSLATGSNASANQTTPYDATVGFDLSRSLVGGREIAPGSTERRRFTLDLTTTIDVPSLYVSASFAQPWLTAPPVTASDVSCTPAPTYNFDPLRPQWATGVAPQGTALRIACDVTLRNTSSARATYMPGVSASQGRSSTLVLPPGEPRAVHVDPVLGTTEFVVSPPAGVAHEGRLFSFESHQVYLRDENRGANTVSWNSNISTHLFAFDPGDVISSAPRPFNRSFNLSSNVDGGASWPTTIEVTTQLPASDLSAFPSASPATGPDGTTYRWSGTQPFGIFGSLRQLTPVVAQPTLAVSRRLDGGREIPAGATVSRQLTATIEVAAASQFLMATVMFRPYVPPGGTAPPVTVSDVSCPGATFYPHDLTTARWFGLAGAAGQTHTLACTVRLTNTSDRPARYMPEVSVFTHVTSVRSVGTDRFAVDDAVLGRASVAVTPPADVVASGSFFHVESRGLILGNENAVVSASPWSFSVTNGLAARTTEDSYADDDRAFSRGWFFALQKPAGWGASIAATTTLDTTGWTTSPEAAPITGAAGTTFRWATTEPSLFTNLNMLRSQTVVTNLGASVTRTLVGPRAVSPGTATRELVIRLVRSTADPIRVSVYFHGSFGAPGGTVTASEVSCAGATPQSPTGAFWLGLTPPIGAPVELRCTARLTNATPYEADYMPLVIVARDASPVVSGPHSGGMTHDVAVDGLGTVRAEVTPPAGVVAEATVTTFATRTLNLSYRNAGVISTRLELTGDGRRYIDEPITLAARLTDAVTGAGVAGRSVELRAGPITRVATTDAAGVASVQLAARALAAGTHALTATFTGQGEHQPTSAAGSLEILRIPTSLAYTGDKSATFGFTSLSARLTDTRTSRPIGGGTVTFEIDGELVATTAADADGVARATLTGTTPVVGTHTVRVSYAGASDLLASETTATLEVKRRPTALVYTGPATSLALDPLTLSATLRETGGAPMAGQLVQFSVDGSLVGSALTDVAGSAGLTLPAGLHAGPRAVQVSFAQTATLMSATASGTIEVTRRPTALAYTGDTSATFGFVTLSARLTDSRTGRPIGGGAVTFSLDGLAVPAVTTDATGVAVLTRIPLPRLQPGTHAIEISYPGDADREPAHATARLVITGSAGKVTGGVVTVNGVRAEINVASDAISTSGQVRIADGTLDLHLKDVRALGIRGNVAVIYAPTADGRHLIAIVTDGGEPGTSDRLILRLDGTPLTADGAISAGNLQINRE